ncbi:MAG: molybdopterin-dependent oxidoreductase [Rhodospirillales bacterium]
MLNRRNFLQVGAAVPLAALAGEALVRQVSAGPVIGGKDFSPYTGKERQAIPSACWQCVTRCPNISYVEGGRLVKIEGQPNSIRTNGVMCSKGQGGVNQFSDPDRILHPMRRVGKRGEGKWKRVSWDEALGEIAGRMKKLRDAGTPEKFCFHYGRMKASQSKLTKMFLSNYGTGTIGNHTSICEGAKWTAQEMTWGGHYDNWDFDHTNYVLNFGSNVFEAHTNHIPVSHRLIARMAEKNIRMVTFDVRLSNTAAKSSEWVPIKPGTDRTVVLAMCNVVMNEGLYKGEGEEFLKFVKVTAGLSATIDEKVAALKAHLAPFTPEWAEKISGVPADKIRTIAREVATSKPACIISYRGAVAHHHGADTERAVQMLASITGNVDNPGGRCKAVGAKWKYPKGPKKKPKARKLKIVDGLKGAAKMPTHHVSHQVLKVIKDGGGGRPDIYMWYCYTPVYANGEVQENIDILKDETLIPFSVCINPFYDESAALADIILPDTPYTERWGWEDMVSPAQIPEYYIRQPAVKPLGECRDFADVCIELADRLGFPLGIKSHEEFVKKSCEKTPAVKAAGGFEYMKANGVYHDPKAKPRYYSYKKVLKPEAYQQPGIVQDPATGVYWNWEKAHVKSEAEALKKGYTHTKKAYKAYVGQEIDGVVYSGFKPDKLNKSGYMELYSEIVEAHDLPAMPSWTPAPEHAAMKPDDMILTTYKIATQIHSRSANCKYLTEISHDNPAWINPASAAEKGIAEGDTIKIKSEFGEIKTTARVTPAIVPGTIAVSHHCGHWEYGRYASGKKAPDGRPDATEAGSIWWKNNGAHPNWIIGTKADPISGQMRWMDTVVSVKKAAANA